MKYFTSGIIALMSVTLFAACQPATPNDNTTQESAEAAMTTQEKMAPNQTSEIQNADIIADPQSYVQENFGMALNLPEGWMAYHDTRQSQPNLNKISFISPEMLEWRKENEKNCDLLMETRDNSIPCEYEAVINFNVRFTYNPERVKPPLAVEGSESESTLNGTTYETYTDPGMVDLSTYVTEKNGNIYEFQAEKSETLEEFLQGVTFED